MEIHLDMAWLVVDQSAKVSVTVARLSVWGLGLGVEMGEGRGRDSKRLLILCV